MKFSPLRKYLVLVGFPNCFPQIFANQMPADDADEYKNELDLR